MSRLLELDARHVWHPFTQAGLADPPLPISRAKGSVLYTDTGREILDGISSWWVNLHGHSHPVIAEAVYRQALSLEHVIFAGFTHTPAVELSAGLAKVLPGNLERIFFSDNGSTAVEVGLKMALQYWHNQGVNRTRILALEGAYHGDTFGAMSVSDRGSFTAPFAPFLFPVEHIPAPLPGAEDEALERLTLALASGDTAVFIYEPLVQGSGGMRMYSPEILGKMLRLVHDSGSLLLADEVMTGFYRTGQLFASSITQSLMPTSRSGDIGAVSALEENHSGTGKSKTPGTPSPDIMTLSKGLTGGAMALGITACTPAIFDVFNSTDRAKTFFHGHSYTANPLACAAALASLELCLSGETADAVSRICAEQQAFWKQLQRNLLAENVRVCGTILAFELAVGGESSYFNPVRDRIYRFFLDKDILLRPLGNTVYVMPPYCFSTPELLRVHQAISELLEEANSW